MSLHRRHLMLLAATAAAGGAHPFARADNSAPIADVNEAINQSGRQRMLSQRMGKAWLAIGLGVDVARAQKALAESMALFERQLQALTAYAPTPEFKQSCGQMAPLWANYQAMLQVAPGAARSEAVRTQGDRVLILAHQSTQQLERFAEQPVARLVNLAGRQRMLSQRLAKCHLALSWGAPAAETQAQILSARRDFVAAHSVLSQAPQTTAAIQQELALVQQQWFFFDHVLARGDASPDTGASHVFVSSENILQVMERITGLYARLGA
jgi:hypothetical protein